MFWPFLSSLGSRKSGQAVPSIIPASWLHSDGLSGAHCPPLTPENIMKVRETPNLMHMGSRGSQHHDCIPPAHSQIPSSGPPAAPYSSLPQRTWLEMKETPNLIFMGSRRVPSIPVLHPHFVRGLFRGARRTDPTWLEAWMVRSHKEFV